MTGGGTAEFGTKLIDLTGGNRTCSPIDPVPSNPLAAPTLMNQDGEPVVCAYRVSLCYRLLPAQRTWSEVTAIDFRSTYNGAALVGDPALRNYWIVGGGAFWENHTASNFYNGDNQITQSQRVVADDVYGDCFLALSESEQLLVNENTWIISNGTWTKLTANFQWDSTIPTARRSFQAGICGLVHDQDGNPKLAVVGGGFAGSIYTQIFDIATRSWRKGPELPGIITQSTSVQAGRSFLVVGGLTKIGDNWWFTQIDTILEFSPDREEWILRPEKLPLVNYDAYATMVNKDVIGC